VATGEELLVSLAGEREVSVQTETHAVGLEDGEDGLLSDELRELDVVLVLLLLVVLVLVVRLELGVLHGDDRASISLDLCAVLQGQVESELRCNVGREVSE
jgi:hypothetical protein